MKQLIALGTGLTALVLLLVACGGDPEDLGPIPTAPSVDTPAREAAPGTVAAYLREIGLDGNIGRLTDPSDCSLLPDDGVQGEFCIVDVASVYATALVIVYVVDVDKQEENIWKVRLEPGAEVWEVIEAPRVPTD